MDFLFCPEDDFLECKVECQDNVVLYSSPYWFSDFSSFTTFQEEWLPHVFNFSLDSVLVKKWIIAFQLRVKFFINSISEKILCFIFSNPKGNHLPPA